MALIGMLLLAYMIVSLGGFSFAKKTYEVDVLFGNVNGLKPGNIVRYAGVDAGRVDAVSIAERGIRVRVAIDRAVSIPEGARFAIATDGLMGDKYVDITPTPAGGPPLRPGVTVRGEDPLGMDKLIATASQALDEVHTLVKALNSVLADTKVQSALRETAFNARDISENLNNLSVVLARMATNNEQNVNSMATDLAIMSANLRQVSGRVDRFMETVDNNGRTALDMREAIANLRATSVRVEKMAASLEGVVTDPAVATNLKETLESAHDVSVKASAFLKRAENVSTKTGFELLYSKQQDRFYSNAEIRVTTSPEDFFVMGLNNEGDENKVNVQVGKGNEQYAQRAGLIASKPGIGLDTTLGSRWRVGVDVYDPNTLKIRLRTQYQLTPNTFLVLQTNSLNREPGRNTYFGVRREY